MKKLLLILFLIVFPLNAQAFDYHGIKPGMSKEQVSRTLKGLGAPEPEERFNLVMFDKDKGHAIKGVKWLPRSLDFYYDHQNQLYSIKINFPRSLMGEGGAPPLIGVSGAAFRSALEKKFGAIVEIKTSDRYTYYEATLIDEKRLAQYLDHLIKETMEEI